MNALAIAQRGLFVLLATSICVSAEPRRYPVQPYVNATLDGWTLLDGGAGSGERGFGLIDLGLDFTLSDKLEGHIGGFLFGGDRDVDGFTGDFGVFSNTLTETRYNVFTAWLQHSFKDSHIRIGQLATDENFFVSENGALFLNSNFGALPTVSANVAAPIFSVGSAGIEYRHEFEKGYFQLGAYAGNPGPGDRDDHGFNWDGGGDDGYFYIAERGWSLNIRSTNQTEIKIGAFFHSGRFSSFEDESQSNGNTAFYSVIDHPLSESVGLFGRVGLSPKSEINVVSSYFDVGFNWQGVLSGRPQDVFGIAYSSSSFARDFRNSIVASDNRSLANERVLEATYLVEFSEGWQVQPSLQYIFNPINAAEDALVAGVRLYFDY